MHQPQPLCTSRLPTNKRVPMECIHGVYPHIPCACSSITAMCGQRNAAHTPPASAQGCLPSGSRAKPQASTKHPPAMCVCFRNVSQGDLLPSTETSKSNSHPVLINTDGSLEDDSCPQLRKTEPACMQQRSCVSTAQ